MQPTFENEACFPCLAWRSRVGDFTLEPAVPAKKYRDTSQLHPTRGPFHVLFLWLKSLLPMLNMVGLS